MSGSRRCWRAAMTSSSATASRTFVLRWIHSTQPARAMNSNDDTSHLHNLNYFYQEGLVKAPLFIQTCFGLLGGIGPHPEEVLHMKRTADRLFGDAYHWSVLGAGRSQMPIRSEERRVGKE